MLKTKVYVGVDSHSKVHKVAILPVSLMETITEKVEEDKWDKVIKQKIKPVNVINNRESYEELDWTLKALADPSEVVFGLEHTGGHYTAPLINYFTERNYQAWYIEAKAFANFKRNTLGQVNKTDKIDSREMAYYLWLRSVSHRALRVSTIQPDLGAESSILRQLLAQRQSIVKARNQATNRLHQLMISTFPEGEAKHFERLLTIALEYPTPRTILNNNNLAEFKYIPQKIKEDIIKLAGETVGVQGEHYEISIKSIARQRQRYLEEIDSLTEEIVLMVNDHPYGRILQSFPHVGAITAATLISVIRDINSYDTPRKLQKMLGVAPGIKQSGKGKGQSKMVYEGNKDARRVIYQIIFGCIRPMSQPNNIKILYDRLKAKGRPGKSAMMRCSVVLCEQIYYCLKNGVFYECQGKGNGNESSLVCQSEHKGQGSEPGDATHPFA